MCEYQWCCLHLCKSKSKKQGPRDSSAASDVEKNETLTSAKSLMWYSTISSRICVEKVLGSCHVYMMTAQQLLRQILKECENGMTLLLFSVLVYIVVCQHLLIK